MGELKAEPYRIRLKEGARPVKVAPYTLPRDANERLKEYLSQLEDLGFIEKCEGPWAAGALLIPSDAEKRGALENQDKALEEEAKVGCRLFCNKNDNYSTTWILSLLLDLRKRTAIATCYGKSMDA